MNCSGSIGDLTGTIRATRMPATVACTPEARMASQTATTGDEQHQGRRRIRPRHKEEEQGEQPGRGGEGNQTDRLRVEEGDDEDRADVVDDGQRGRKTFRPSGTRRPSSARTPSGEGDVGRHRDAPAVRARAARVDRQ